MRGVILLLLLPCAASTPAAATLTIGDCHLSQQPGASGELTSSCPISTGGSGDGALLALINELNATIQAQASRITALEAYRPVNVGEEHDGSGGGYTLGVWDSPLPTNARSTPDNRCNEGATVLSGQQNWGTSSYTTFNATGGYYSGCKPCRIFLHFPRARSLTSWCPLCPCAVPLGGYARGYLHLLTDMTCGSGGGSGIYSFGLTGAIYLGGPLDCRLSGESTASGVIQLYEHCAYNAGGMTPASYCNSNGRVVLRLSGVSMSSRPHNSYWHAGSISVAAYGRSWNRRIEMGLHSTLAQEDFALGVDRRSQTD